MQFVYFFHAALAGNKSIVIFGNFFLSWSHFQGNNRITYIFNFLLYRLNFIGDGLPPAALAP